MIGSNKKNLCFALISLLIGSNVVLAATASNANLSFTIRQPENPLKPVLFEIPTEAVCLNFADFDGRAESNVEIYLDGEYQTVSGVADGSFNVRLFLEEGENTFVLQAKRDDEFSDESIYTIENTTDCLISVAYAASSTQKKSTDTVNLKSVANHLEVREIDKYIEETLKVKDLKIEPLDAPNEQDEILSAEKKHPFKDAADLGIKHTFDDFDSDGVSDTMEVVLGFDTNKKDSDADGIADVEEISIGDKIEAELYSLNVNFAKEKSFTCDDLVLHGELNNKFETESAQDKLQFCLSGKNAEECFDINVESNGAFIAALAPKVQEGSYTARFSVNDTILDEFETQCTSAKRLADVMISQVDFQKVYTEQAGRAVKKVRLYSFSPQPVVKGVGSNHDIVFGFFIQNGEKVAQSLAMSDANGAFEAKPHKRLKSKFGFGKASILAYGLSEGQFGGTDTVEFYIFDLFIIALEIIVLILAVAALKKIINRYLPRKKRR